MSVNGQTQAVEPTGTDFYPERSYLTKVIPRHLAELMEEVMETCRSVIEITGDTLSGMKPEVRRNECLEAALTSCLLAERLYLHQLLVAGAGGVQDRYERIDAARRDHWQCLLCQHSQCNAGGTELHHIIPRSEFGPMWDAVKEIIGSKHSSRNLATLCAKCHGQITNPQTEAWKWRNQAPTLYGLIGEPELADLVSNWTPNQV